jgi:23S rRNA pseudouridine1911/1915/1917 synthase
MCKPGTGCSGFDMFAAARRKSFAKNRIEEDPGTFGAHCQLDLAVASLRPDIEPATANQCVASEQSEIEKKFDRPFWKLFALDNPAQFNLAFCSEQTLEGRLCLGRVDLFGKPAASAEREAEELEFVGGGLRTVGEQFEALLAHLRVGLVPEQFDAVVQGADRRHEVVTEPRAKQAGKIDRVHAGLNAAEFNLAQGGGIERRRHETHILSRKMGGIQTINVRLEAAHSGWRLDRALAAAVPTLSRERLKALIRSGAVEAQGSAVRDPALKVKGGEALRVTVPEAAPAHNEPQDIPLAIVFEDEHLLVVDKPAGLVVHPAAGNLDGTLVNALLHHCAGNLSGIGGVARPGIVHRIDKDTSGLLVVAKTDVAHEGLARQFAAHSIERRYLAIVSGIPKVGEGTIEAPLARSATNRKKIAIVEGHRGKRAVTHWKRVELLKDAALIECRLETGRTHQVRVHLASIGHPLLGDPVYGRAGKTHGNVLKELGFQRQALHAAQLGFTHPVTKNRLSFSSAMPPDMQELKRALGV